MADFNISHIQPKHHDEALEFLREHFFPHEPCARAIDLCAHGYRQVVPSIFVIGTMTYDLFTRMPAVEADIKNIMAKGHSLMALSKDGSEILGLIVMDKLASI